MTLNVTLLKTAILGAVLGLGVMPANAQSITIRSGSAVSSCAPVGYNARYAGTLWINGHSTRIRADRPLASQIRRAFRKAGYYARTSDGCIVVDYSSCDRPRVRWQGSGYNLGMQWGYDSARFSIKKYRAPIVRSSHYGYDDWRRSRRNGSHHGRRGR